MDIKIGDLSNSKAYYMGRLHNFMVHSVRRTC